MVEEQGLYRLTDNVQQAFLFRDRVKQALNLGGKDLSDDDAIVFVERLISRHKHWERDHEFIRFAIEVKQLLIGSYVDATLTNDEAIAEIKRLQQLATSNNQDASHEEEIAKLKHTYRQALCENEKYIAKLIGDLRIANKVIARLVGE